MEALQKVIVFSGDRIKLTPAGERHRALAVAQALAGQMQGDERRRARGIDRDARPLESQNVRQTPRRDAVGGAGGIVSIVAIGVLSARQNLPIVGLAHADEHAGAAAGQPVRRDAGVLQRLPAHLQKQALLRVHLDRLARRDAEELRIELVHAAKKRAAAHVHFSRLAPVRIEIGVDIPAPGGNLRHCISAVAKQPPESLRIIGVSGKSAGHADDRQRLLPPLLDGIEPRLKLLQLQVGLLQGGELLVFLRHRSRLTASPIF